jgi:hypothetical protein
MFPIWLTEIIDGAIQAFQKLADDEDGFPLCGSLTEVLGHLA